MADFGLFTIRRHVRNMPIAAVVLIAFFFSIAIGEATAKDDGPLKTPYIAGGQKSKAVKHPGLVQLTYDGHVACGGALIHPMLVLTAISCLWDHQQGGWWPDKQHLQIFAGRTAAHSGGEELPVNNWTGSRNYNEFTGENDYGLIVLADPATYPTLKIAGPTERALWRAGRKNVVAGFGSTSNSAPNSSVLRSTKLPILKDSLCRSAKSYGKEFFPDSMLCAGFMKGGSSPCNGDWGAPLTAPIDGGGHRLVGLAIWGDGCGKRNKPWVFSRVAQPSISAAINELGADAAHTFRFPGRNSYVNVVGIGAKPLGCAAAKSKKNAAAAKWAKAKQTNPTSKAAAKAKKKFKAAAKTRKTACK